MYNRTIGHGTNAIHAALELPQALDAILTSLDAVPMKVDTASILNANDGPRLVDVNARQTFPIRMPR